MKKLISVLKHMSGKHDQKSHGGRRGGINVDTMIKNKKIRSNLTKGAKQVGKKMFGKLLVFEESDDFRTEDARKSQLRSAYESGISYGESTFLDEFDYMYELDTKTGKADLFKPYQEEFEATNVEKISEFYVDKKNTGKVLAMYRGMDASITVFKPNMIDKPDDNFEPMSPILD